MSHRVGSDFVTPHSAGVRKDSPKGKHSDLCKRSLDISFHVLKIDAASIR